MLYYTFLASETRPVSALFSFWQHQHTVKHNFADQNFRVLHTQGISCDFMFAYCCLSDIPSFISFFEK